MNVRYRVELSQAERCELTAMLSKGKRAARKLKRAQILLAADAGCSDEEIARTVAVGGSTVYRTKRRFVEGNLERALSEDPRPGAERKLTGKEEALLVATACANPPKGRARWTLELLADAYGQAHRAREPVGRDGAPAVGRKRSQALAQGYVVHSPGRRRVCCPHGRRARPLCRSARSQAAGGLLRREPGPTDRRGAPADPGRAGSARTYDYEYRRNGTVNLFVCIDVHRPWRKVKLTERRAAEDYAQCMRELIDVHQQRNAAGARIKWMFTTEKSPRQNGPRLPHHVQRVIITVPRY
jgi:transposase